jgi:hypothetical protein
MLVYDVVVAALFAVTVVQQYQVDAGSGWDAVWEFAVLPLMAFVGFLTAVYGILDLSGRPGTDEATMTKRTDEREAAHG